MESDRLPGLYVSLSLYLMLAIALLLIVQQFTPTTVDETPKPDSVARKVYWKTDRTQLQKQRRFAPAKGRDADQRPLGPLVVSLPSSMRLDVTSDDPDSEQSQQLLEDVIDGWLLFTELEAEDPAPGENPEEPAVPKNSTETESKEADAPEPSTQTPLPDDATIQEQILSMALTDPEFEQWWLEYAALYEPDLLEWDSIFDDLDIQWDPDEMREPPLLIPLTAPDELIPQEQPNPE